MPPTASPSPFHSATPRRISGPNHTVPRSRIRTGVPFLLAAGERPQIAQAPNHVLGAPELKQPPAHLVGAVTDLVDHRRERDVKGAELVGIQSDLVLTDKTADRRDFRHPWNRLDLIPEKPILEAAQIGETVAMVVIDDEVLIHPACGGRVRPDHRVDPGGKAPGNLLEILQDTRARPAQIRAL